MIIISQDRTEVFLNVTSVSQQNEYIWAKFPNGSKERIGKYDNVNKAKEILDRFISHIKSGDEKPFDFSECTEIRMSAENLKKELERTYCE